MSINNSYAPTYAPTYAPLGGRQGPYLPSADSSEHDLKRGELRFMLPKVMRTSGAFTVGVLIMIKRRVLRLHAFCHFLLNLVQYSNNFLVLLVTN